jgi:putative ABC transport system permease protein
LSSGTFASLPGKLLALINKLVIENLKHRPVRTLLGVLAIAIEVTMILTLVGLSRGMLDDSARRARGVGADIWVRPPGSSAISFSSSPMDQRLADFLERQPGVEIALGNIIQPIEGVDTVSGIDYERFDRMSGGLRFLAGGPFEHEDDVIIDQRLADQQKLKVGDTIRMLNRDWRVCGIVEPGKLARKLVQRDRLQELTGNTGKVTQILVKLQDPSQTDAKVEEFRRLLPEYRIYSIEEFTSLFSIDNVPGLRPFIVVVILISVIVGFLVVFLSMYTAVLERTREIGILKSMGASPAYILGMLMRETAVLTLLGSALGIVLTFGTRAVVMVLAGASLTQMIVPDWWPIATAISMAGALLGAAYPAWKAVNQDVLEALSYE